MDYRSTVENLLRSARELVLRGEARRRSDERLVRRLRRGEESALGELYDRHGRVAYGLALRLLGEPRLAAGIVEDSFATLARRSVDVARGPTSPPTWLLTLVHRRATDRRRSSPSRARTTTAAGTTPSDSGDGSPGRTRAERALERLTHPQREVLALAYFDGMSVADVADRLGHSPETIRDTLATALHGLQDAFADDAERGAAPEIEESLDSEPSHAWRFRPEGEQGSPFTLGDGDVDRGRRA